MSHRFYGVTRSVPSVPSVPDIPGNNKHGTVGTLGTGYITRSENIVKKQGHLIGSAGINNIGVIKVVSGSADNALRTFGGASFKAEFYRMG